MRTTLTCSVLAASLALAGCTSGSDPQPDATATFQPVSAPSVGLGVGAQLPAPLRLGVVVTGAAERGQGTEFAALAAGARVAEFRLDDGTPDRVTLEVVDDRGTSEGAVAAAQQLVDSGVAGIVWASSGDHLDAALPLAAAAGTAVLLPYDGRSSAGETAWRTGPTSDQVAEELEALLRARGASRPFVLSGEGHDVALPGAGSGPVAAGPELTGQVARAAGDLTSGAADAVVVAASAQTSAEAVAALQATQPGVPVLLGPAATAPAFAATLAELGATGAATTAGQFFSVGPAGGDTSSEPGAVAFLSAVRLAAQDRGLPSLLQTDDLAVDGAATADARSHDAVVALARAAVQAGSVAPADVLAALRGLVVEPADGLAGPRLDFRAPVALAPEDVVVLQATTRVPVRAGVEQAAPALTWFAVPDEQPTAP